MKDSNSSFDKHAIAVSFRELRCDSAEEFGVRHPFQILRQSVSGHLSLGRDSRNHRLHSLRVRSIRDADFEMLVGNQVRDPVAAKRLLDLFVHDSCCKISNAARCVCINERGNEQMNVILVHILLNKAHIISVYNCN